MNIQNNRPHVRQSRVQAPRTEKSNSHPEATADTVTLGSGGLADMAVNATLGTLGGGVSGLVGGAVIANSLGMGALGTAGMSIAGGALGGVAGFSLGVVLT